ncbi:hypothetical protein GCM10027347_52480 [Larkinella harenae]
MSNQQSKPGQTSDSKQNPEANKGAGSQNPNESQQKPSAEPAPAPDFTKTPEFETAVDAAVEKRFAEFEQRMADKKKQEEEDARAAAEAAQLEEKRLIEEAQAREAEEVDMSKPLFGNKDRKKEFDLRKFLPIAKLPDDKVIIVKRQYYTDPAGDVKETEKLREIQFVNPQDFEAWSKPNDKNGLSIYEALGVNYTLVHKPE